MAGDTGALLMMVIPVKGQPAIRGESSSDFTSTTSPLMKGFKADAVFEIANFTFGVASEQEDPRDKRARELLAAGQKNETPPPGKKRPTSILTTLKTGEARSCPMKDVTFTRPIDRASTELLSYFVKSTTMYGAAVVKRKPAGGLSAGEPYLRLEFIGVLFTHITWSNDDPVTENCTFIARAVNVMYKPQLPDGSLGATRNGFWSRIPNQNEELSC